MSVIIETEKLCCRTGQRYLIGDISWQVAQGEHWCVFGMNGCGKTTLLSTIAGFKQPTGGVLRVFGEAYSVENVLAHRRRIGWVSSSFFDQYYHKESALSIVLSGKTGGFGLDETITAQDIKRAKALLSELRLAERINHPFGLLSKGERQNVLLARALLASPDILILDEPCSGLDVIAREYVLGMVQELAANTDITVIYVTHYTEEILDIFQHTLLLKNGRVYAQGRTEELFTQERLSDFLDHPVAVQRDGRGRVQVSAEVHSRLRDLVKEVQNG